MAKTQIFRLPILGMTGRADDVLSNLDELRRIIAEKRSSIIDIEIDAAKIIFYEVNLMQNKMTDYGVLVFPKLNWRQILGCDMTAFVYARLRDGWQKKEIEKAIFDASRECGMDEKTLKGRIEIGVRARMAEFNRRL